MEDCLVDLKDKYKIEFSKRIEGDDFFIYKIVIKINEMESIYFDQDIKYINYFYNIFKNEYNINYTINSSYEDDTMSLSDIKEFLQNKGIKYFNLNIHLANNK